VAVVVGGAARPFVAVLMLRVMINGFDDADA
jgi:hypothetical protein